MEISSDDGVDDDDGGGGGVDGYVIYLVAS